MMYKLNRKSVVFILIFLFLASFSWAGGVLSSPRKVYLVKTAHFEIIFCESSAETAKIIADNIEELYEKAKSLSHLEYDFSMPVVISPDSEELQVTYTNSPYNRIVIFDAVASEKQALYSDNLLSLLYREIFRAASASVRSPINQFIHKTVGHDPYQPVSLLYLPFSFVEGYTNLAAAPDATGAAGESSLEADFYDYLNDSYNLQLLIQAKLENHFPTWFQASSPRDIYPGAAISQAAGTAFTAFLMQNWGVEKYADFWNECGRLTFNVLGGIFYKIYGISLTKAWSQFKELIPVPEDLESLAENEKYTREIFKNDLQGVYEHVLYSNYGLLWYDDIRHEVSLFDRNSRFSIRQLLFLADDVKSMALSPDGRYVAVSFVRDKSRDAFKEYVTEIFDLKEREFLDYRFNFRTAGFVTALDGSLCLAGICVNQKIPVMQVFTLPHDEDDSELIYESRFDKDEVPFSVNYGGQGKVIFLLKKNGRTNLVARDFTTSQNDVMYDLTPLGDVQKLIFIEKNTYTFQFLPKEKGSLSRMGFIFMDDAGRISELKVQTRDFLGGIYYPFVKNNMLYYSAKKFSHHELRYVPVENVSFETLSQENFALVEELSDSVPPVAAETYSSANLFSKENKTLGEYSLKTYNPFKYIIRPSFTPMLAIRDVTLEKGAVLWPSLGFYVQANSDPLRNTTMLLSAGTDFLVLAIQKYINETEEDRRVILRDAINQTKRYNLGFFIENTSTPVDISAGAIFNVNKYGAYDFKVVGNTAWQVPVGRIIRDMNFSIASVYTASTDYYDTNKSEAFPSLAGWTPFWDAYGLMELSATVEYSNSHQYGISKYERRGLSVGGRFYVQWDTYEMDLLNKYRDENQQKIDNGEETELTQAQLEALYSEGVMDVSQMNIGLFATIEIPRLTPLSMHNGWVLSLPASVHAEFMNEAGTALEAVAEVLLVGNEVQNGFPFLYLFFSRCGLKGGYDFRLNYDTTQVMLPDVRRENYVWEVLSQTYIRDSFYLSLDTDFSVPIGKLSEMQFNMTAKAEFFPRTQGFKFTFNVETSF